MKKVSVDMITYNHEKYIAQAIDSVLMQKTNFPFEIVIGEDCSTDGTRGIVFEYAKKYPEIISVITSEKNVGAMQNFIRTLNACQGKYIALCEGDDYWTDPLKLQKQVDFLEANPDFGMVHTGAIVVDKNGKKILEIIKEKPSGEVFIDLFKSSFIITCTACGRADVFRKLAERAKQENLWFIMDLWLWMQTAMQSKVYYLQEITGAYRSHKGGISQQKDSFFKRRIPLIILDTISIRINESKITPLNKKDKWFLFTKFCSALLSINIKFNDKLKYIKNTKINLLYYFAIFPVAYKKIIRRLRKRLRI